MSKLRFVGNHAISDDDLKRGLALGRSAPEARGGAPDPVLGRASTPSAFGGHYARRGFLDAGVRAHTDRVGLAATVVFEIDEGRARADADRHLPACRPGPAGYRAREERSACRRCRSAGRRPVRLRRLRRREARAARRRRERRLCARHARRAGHRRSREPPRGRAADLRHRAAVQVRRGQDRGHRTAISPRRSTSARRLRRGAIAYFDRGAAPRRSARSTA